MNTPGTHRPSSTTMALTGLSLSMLLSSLGTSSANVGLPTIATAFGAPFQDVQWVVLAYLLAITALIVSVGRLGDVLGRRKLLLAGLVLFTGASVLCGIAPWFSLLIVARAMQGIGAAVMMALTMAFVGDTVPKEKTGSAMGLLGTMSAVGTALGPSLGGLLIAAFGWRAVFLSNLPLGLIAIFLAWHSLPADRQPATAAPTRFDLPGTLLLVLALAAYALGVTTGRGAFGMLNIALLLTAAIGTGLFILVEAGSAAPLVRPAMFREPTLASGFAGSALVATVMMATLVVGPFYLSGALGLDAAHTGMAMSSGPMVSALAGIPAGRMVDRFGAFRITVGGLVWMAAGCCVLPMLSPGLGVIGYVAPLVVITSGYALFQAANNTAVMENVPADRRGVVSGMLNLSRNLGLITGASVMGAVFAAASGTKDITPVHALSAADGMHVTFSVAAALVIVALGIACTARSHAGRALPVHD